MNSILKCVHCPVYRLDIMARIYFNNTLLENLLKRTVNLQSSSKKRYFKDFIVGKRASYKIVQVRSGTILEILFLDSKKTQKNILEFSISKLCKVVFISI